jgi:hypothetical protein
MWGVALLGHSRPAEAATRLARSIRAADRAGWIAQLEQSAAALTLACAEGGDPVLAAQISGYVRSKLGAQRIRTPMREWLDERLDAALTGLAETERAQAIESGTHLDRRGFMDLVAQAEDLSGHEQNLG